MTIRHDDKNKKHLIRAGIAFVATAGVLIGGLFHSPADLVADPLARMTAPPAVELVIDTAEEDPIPDPDGDGGADKPTDKEEKRSLRERLRNAFLRLPKGVRAVAGVPLWAIGWVIITTATALWSAVLSPVISTIGGWLLTGAFILLCTLCAVKAAHPELPLKKILNRKTVCGVLIAVLALAGADAVLPFFWDDYEKAANLLRCAAATALLGGTVLPKLLCKRKAKSTT